LKNLEDAFEEERDVDRFIGDKMFWQHFEDIDVRRIYRTSSCEYRNLKLMFFESTFYIILLAVLTSFVFELLDRQVYETRREQLQYWGGCDISSNNEMQSCRINTVVDIQSYWEWMIGDFVPLAFTHDSKDANIARIQTAYPDNEFGITFSPRYVGASEMTVLLGSIRVRQQRVGMGRGCKVSSQFRHIFSQCYAGFDSSSKSMDGFALRWTPSYIKSAFVHAPETDTKGVPLAGSVAEYHGDGFYFDVPQNRTEAEMMLQDLWTWQWVDRATRAIVIEYSTLNVNVNIITNNRILFESDPSGGFRADHQAQVVRALLLSASPAAGVELGMFIYQVVLVLLFLGYNAFVFWLLGKTQHKFFTYGWNWCDIAILILFYATLWTRIQAYVKASSEEALSPAVIGHPEEFMPLAGICQTLALSNQLLSFLVLIAWVKVLKYLSLIGFFRLLIRVLERCAAELMVFAALLLVLFFAFAVPFFVALGVTDGDFVTLPGSFLVLFFMLVQGMTMKDEWFEPGRSATVPLLALAYMLLVYFVILNIFMAIVLDAYTIVYILHQPDKSERDSKDNPQVSKKNSMIVFIYTYYHHLKGISLVKEFEEELGLPDEQSIEVKYLPGLVVKKWLEKKKSMQRVVEQTLGELPHTAKSHWNKSGADKKMGTWAKAQASLKQAMALPSMTDFTPKPPSDGVNEDMQTLEGIENSKEAVSRFQLQRILDEDKTLRLLLGTSRAIDVIRRFKKSSAVDGVDEVSRLQESVFRKLDRLEKQGLDIDVEEVPEVTEISARLSDSLNEVQNQWRQELTAVLEMASQLSEGLIELTQGLEKVGQNHNAMLDQLGPTDSYTGSGSQSGSSQG